MAIRYARRLMLLWSVWLFIGAPFSMAHEESHQPVPTVTVAAAGRLSMAPDMAVVTFGMQTAGKSLAEAQRQNTRVMQKVAERLRDLQIEPERIQTSSFTVTPQYKPPQKSGGDMIPVVPEIIGYTVGNTVSVELFAIEKVAAVIEQTLAAGANQYQGVQWGVRDEQQAKLRALKQAAAKARDKALALSEALKVTLGRLLTVSEEGHVGRPTPYMAKSMMAMEAGGEPPIFGGEMTVEASVTLVYEIVQPDRTVSP